MSLEQRERQRRKDEQRVSLMREREKNGKLTFLAEGLRSIFSMQLIKINIFKILFSRAGFSPRISSSFQ